ncbi:MAG: hypothetical protein ACJ8AP_14910 [Gemmatimonadales bacterium]
MRYPGIPVALIVSLLACDQQPVAPVAETGPDLVRAAKVDANKNLVIRFEDHFAQSWTGANGSLRATHTTFPIPFGDPPEPEPDCGPQEDLAMINWKRVGVENPVDFFLSEFHINASGPVWVIVRDLSQPGDCYGVKLIAEGLGTIRYLDNDWFGQNEGQTHANSWGFLASGTLTTPDGRTLRYQGVSRYVVTFNGGEPTFTAVVERVSLQ